MDFLGIGFWEIVLILIIALIIWGPGRMAEIGRMLGKIVRSLRKMSSDFTVQITKELEEEEKKPAPKLPEKDKQFRNNE